MAPRLCSPGTLACFRDDDVPLCLSGDRICDGARDCKDGHDENNCLFSQSTHSTRSWLHPQSTTIVNLQETKSLHFAMPSTTYFSLGNRLTNINIVGTTHGTYALVAVPCLVVILPIAVWCIIYRTKHSRTNKTSPLQAQKTNPNTSATSAEPRYETINEYGLELNDLEVVSSNQSVYPSTSVTASGDASGSTQNISISETESTRLSGLSCQMSSSGDCVTFATSGGNSGELMVAVSGGDQGTQHSPYSEIVTFSRGIKEENIRYELPLKQPSLFYPKMQHNYMSLGGIAKKDSDASEYEPLMHTCDTAATILEIKPMDMVNSELENTCDLGE